MKGGKLKDWYGRRFTPFSNILSVLLVIAFAVCLALAPTDENKNRKTDQLEQSDEK